MELFKNDQIRKALDLSCFIDLINVIAPLYDEKIPLNIITSIPWNKAQEILNDYIIMGLNNLTDSADQLVTAVWPKIIKGVYFCLGDVATDLTIHGSLYYNEDEWACNADYEFKLVNLELLDELSDILTSLKLDFQNIQDLLCLFVAFTLLKTLKTVGNSISDIKNAGITLGYSDGDILVLGHFLDQQFIEQIEIIENGEYENPSTAPEIIQEPVAARGDFWYYLRNNCMPFIETHGLSESFYKLGEEEAERISEIFKNQLHLNLCPICNSIKKTPRARLCLKCGEFTPPVEC